MLMSQGSLGIFVNNGLVTTLVAAGFALLLLPPFFRMIGVWRNARR
jgi:TctA family transporter